MVQQDLSLQLAEDLILMEEKKLKQVVEIIIGLSRY